MKCINIHKLYSLINTPSFIVDNSFCQYSHLEKFSLEFFYNTFPLLGLLIWLELLLLLPPHHQHLMNYPFWHLFQMAYYGHALYDAEATIVHHFAHYKNPTWFPYPMLSAGVVFTGALLRRWVQKRKGNWSLPGVAITHHGTCICICRLAELVAASSSSSISSSGSGSSSRRRHSEFAIDAAHELARFIFDNLTPATPNDDEAGNSKNITVEDASNMLQGKIILKSAAYICPSANLSPASSTASSGMPNQRLKKEKSVSCLLYAKSEASTGSSEHCVSWFMSVFTWTSSARDVPRVSKVRQ